MDRNARVVTPEVGLSRPTIVAPVIFDQGEAFAADVVLDLLRGHALPRSFSAEWCRRQGLRAEPGSATVLRTLQGSNIALVTVGSTLNDLDHYRLAGAAAVRCAGEDAVAFLLPTDGLDEPVDVAQALVEGALLASYSFKNREGRDDVTFDVVPLGAPLPTVAAHDDVAEGVRRGVIVADGVNWAKHLINSPAGSLPPKELAKQAVERLERSPHVSIEAWTESRIKKERLGGLLGVAQGSAQPARLVHAVYDPRPKVALPHVALVGKGVTFDSGGLSLKSPDGMTTMKTDMTGAAVVLAVLSIVSALELDVRLTVIAPLAENLPGDKATKPGDVLTIRNGMTIEVLNTDAEGRLILADGLSLAVEANPDAIIDVATLTGAQAVALGDEVGALFATTDELANYFARAGERSGEQLWRLPLVASYESHIDSDVADMKNIGKPGKAGAIAAALLLQRFTDSRPWVHFDIAGPGRSDAARGYVTKGATAFSARTIVEFLAAVANEAAEATI